MAQGRSGARMALRCLPVVEGPLPKLAFLRRPPFFVGLGAVTVAACGPTFQTGDGGGTGGLDRAGAGFGSGGDAGRSGSSGAGAGGSAKGGAAGAANASASGGDAGSPATG